jgi:hypothetical protein
VRVEVEPRGKEKEKSSSCLSDPDEGAVKRDGERDMDRDMYGNRD